MIFLKPLPSLVIEMTGDGSAWWISWGNFMKKISHDITDNFLLHNRFAIGGPDYGCSVSGKRIPYGMWQRTYA